MQTSAAILLLAGLALAGCDDSYVEADTPALTVYETACLSAVASATARSGVSVESSRLSEADDTAVVAVAVAGAAGPWVCESSAAGAVRSVRYGGSAAAV